MANLRNANETVWMMNTTTGVPQLVDKDMVGHPAWKHFLPMDEEPTFEVKPKLNEAGNFPDVIMTDKGVPFKTEAAALSAMKRKNVPEGEFIAIESDGGFIITRICQKASL